MIAPADGLPLLRLESGQVTRLREEWLASSLHHAALDAGLERWWPAPDVAHSIIAYLRNGYEARTISLPVLEAAVRQVLGTLGFPEVGDRFTTDPPIIQIALPALAHEAQPGCHLLFFHLLNRRLEESVRHSRQQIELLGLRAAVKILLSRHLWSKSCFSLECEIVGYVRGKLALARPADSVRATIS